MQLLGRRLTILAAVGLPLGAVCCKATTNYPLGKLSARVIDANSAGVQGVVVKLYKHEAMGPVLWRAGTTSSDGISEFGASEGGVIAGEYFIRVSFVTQHQLAPGESNDRPVTLNEGDDIVVTFRVVPKAVTR